MPFLHGFRRIIFEYQPLVDEILGLLAIQDAEQQSALESPACLGSDRSQLSAVRRVLERETHSPFYQEAVSYALLKVTELGLVPAAEVLLEFGADLSFEDPVTYYTPLHIAVLRNQPDMVELLVHHGADINRRDRERQHCCMPWPAVTGSRSTTRRASVSCWKEVQMSEPPPKMVTLSSPTSSSCWERWCAATLRRHR
ncbi:ankyrin repeat and SOCS box protein 6 isoform X2 [Balearica regulorum gibbericeps]|uniref:ankyrin repeat and SOCS box protein 6 isoform X2 n=1 Tax=Balearica regulorum gibbericeps TaxID=100784 RepID=UPI003F5E3B9F